MRRLPWLLAVTAALTLPAWLGDYALHICILIALFAFAGTCWSFLGGLAGQLSLGGALFFGVGAYSYSLARYTVGLHWTAAILAALATALLISLALGALLFGFGLRSASFTMATIAAAEIGRVVALHTHILGAAEGLSLPYPPAISSKVAAFYIVVGLLGGVLALAHALGGSRLGRAFRLLSQHEGTAIATGIDPLRAKVGAFCVSAVGLAIGGVFYSEYFLYLHPDSELGLQLSVRIAAVAIFGGRDFFLGAIIGSLILTPLAEMSRELVGLGGPGMHQVIHGTALILACLFFPSGISKHLRRSGQ